MLPTLQWALRREYHSGRKGYLPYQSMDLAIDHYLETLPMVSERLSQTNLRCHDDKEVSVLA